MDLPTCRYRGPDYRGRHACASPFVYVPDERGVRPADCQRCIYADRVPNPAERKILGVREGPAWARRAMTFLRSLWRHASDWFRQAPAAEQQRRRTLCRACEHYLPLYRGGRCAKCGCGIAGAVLDKTRWASERCPEGKW